MSIELIGLRVTSVVLHEVPAPAAGGRARNEGPRVQPVLSTAVSELTDDLRAFFESKISETAHAGECFEALFDEESTSPVRGLVTNVLADQDELLAASQDIARHLASVQTAQNSPGILAVATVSFRGSGGVAILKLEHEQGVQLRRILDDDGTVVSLSVEHVRELLLTQKTKLHKQAFVRELEDQSLLLHITDRQRSRTSDVRSARFFVEQFLGAKETRDPKVMTRDFFYSTVEFINEHLADDPERAKDLCLDLVSYMRANVAYASVADFSGQYLEQGEKEPYRTFMEPKLEGMPARIQKDTDLIAADLKRFRLVGASGITVSGPPDAMAERVLSEGTAEAGISKVVITDQFTVRP